jgi:hypothetical protein
MVGLATLSFLNTWLQVLFKVMDRKVEFSFQIITGRAMRTLRYQANSKRKTAGLSRIISEARNNSSRVASTALTARAFKTSSRLTPKIES